MRYVGIRIHSNTNRLIVGTEMTVRVIGPDGETPFTLGAVGIAFGWESSDPSVAAMVPIYKEGRLPLTLASIASVIVGS